MSKANRRCPECGWTYWGYPNSPAVPSHWIKRSAGQLLVMFTSTIGAEHCKGSGKTGENFAGEESPPAVKDPAPMSDDEIKRHWKMATEGVTALVARMDSLGQYVRALLDKKLTAKPGCEHAYEASYYSSREQLLTVACVKCAAKTTVKVPLKTMIMFLKDILKNLDDLLPLTKEPGDGKQASAEPSREAAGPV